MRTCKQHYKRVCYIHRPFVSIVFPRESHLSKRKIGTLQKHHHPSAIMFTCLALCCSLLEVESEELGMGFKNTKQEAQKYKTKCKAMWIAEQLTKPMEINYVNKNQSKTKNHPSSKHKQIANTFVLPKRTAQNHLEPYVESENPLQFANRWWWIWNPTILLLVKQFRSQERRLFLHAAFHNALRQFYCNLINAMYRHSKQAYI